MKKFMLIAFILILGISASTAVETVISYDELRLDLIKTDPSPLEPGKTFDIYFDVTNLQSYTIKNIQISLVDLFPFYTTNKNQSSIFINELKSGEKTAIKYNVGINKDISDGSYQLSLQYYSTKLSAIVSRTFDMNIKTTGVIVSSTNIKLNPERVRPGGTAELELELRNNANSAITDITTDLVFDGTPFVTLGETSEKKIRQLAQNAKATVKYSLIVNPDAQSKVYRVPLLITYHDSLGTEFTRNNSIGIVVYSKPEYTIDMENAKVFTGKQTGEVTVSIANTGNSDLKFLSIELIDEDSYDIISNPRVYVGNLQSDDFETATYNIYTASARPTDLKLKLTYKDGYNNDFSDDVQVTLPLYSKWRAQDLGLIERDMTWLYAIISLASVVFAYKFYKIWKYERDVENTIKSMFRSIKSLIRKKLSKSR